MVYRLGRSLPGIFIDNIKTTKCLTKIFLGSKKYLMCQILTKDSVTVYVNAVMYYRVADAESAVNNVDDYAESARLIASTTLRNVLGTKTLGSILSGSEVDMYCIDGDG